MEKTAGLYPTDFDVAMDDGLGPEDGNANGDFREQNGAMGKLERRMAAIRAQRRKAEAQLDAERQGTEKADTAKRQKTDWMKQGHRHPGETEAGWAGVTLLGQGGQGAAGLWIKTDKTTNRVMEKMVRVELLLVYQHADCL